MTAAELVLAGNFTGGGIKQFNFACGANYPHRALKGVILHLGESANLTDYEFGRRVDRRRWLGTCAVIQLERSIAANSVIGREGGLMFNRGANAGLWCLNPCAWRVSVRTGAE